MYGPPTKRGAAPHPSAMESSATIQAQRNCSRIAAVALRTTVKGGVDESEISSANCPLSSVRIDASGASGQRDMLAVAILRHSSRDARHDGHISADRHSGEAKIGEEV